MCLSYFFGDEVVYVVLFSLRAAKLLGDFGITWILAALLF
jgi:hypothetical protein